MAKPIPTLLRVISALLPEAEREQIVGDLCEEFTKLGPSGRRRSNFWLARQGLVLSLAFLFHGLRRRSRGVGGTAHRSASPLPPERERIMETLWKDLRHAVRLFVRQPSYTLGIVVTLALGIGANTAIFSVVNGVLLRPLPYESPEELVLFRADLWGLVGNPGIALGEARDFSDRARTLEDVGSVARHVRRVLTGENPVSVVTARITPNLFPLLGVSPEVGRLFSEDDIDADNVTSVAIIGYDLWQSQLEGRSEIVGSSIEMEGRIWEVIGVMPPDFSIHLDPASGVSPEIEVWTPMLLSDNRGFWGFRSIGRLADGATFEQARGEVLQLGQQFVEEFPDVYTGMNIQHRLLPLHGDLVSDVRPSILVLLGAVGLVLLIACINGAGLILARTAGRESELALRSAMGAGRSRIVRQILTESLVMALGAGVLGLMIGYAAVQGLIALQPGDLPRVDAIGLDPWVLGFTFGIAALASLLSGLVPALRASRPQLYSLLKDGGGNSGGRRIGRLHRGLVVAEIAFSLMLLVGTGLMIRTFMGLRQVDLGFAPESVLTMEVPVDLNAFPRPEERWVFFNHVVERVGVLPGVEQVGGVSDLPFGITIPLKAPFGTDARPELLTETNADYRYVLPGYFNAMGIELVAGRTFAASDNFDTLSVAVIDEAVAETAWPGEDPIGRIIQMNLGTRFPETNATVIGVVRSTRVTTVREEGLPQLYLPYWASGQFSMMLTVRTELAVPEELVPQIQGELQAAGSSWPVRDVRRMESYVSGATARDRFMLVLMSVMGGLALLLAAVGIYSVIAYLVSQRHREMGLRMALGADRRAILGLNLREGLTLGALGVPIGILGSFLLARSLERLLFEVAPTDLTTFMASPLALLAVAVVASYIPARRAAGADPAHALKAE